MNKFDEIYFKIISEAKSKTDDFDVEKFINSISKSQLLAAAAKVRAKVKKLDQSVTANKRAYDYLLPETLGQDFVNAIVKIMKKNATKEITNKRKFAEDCIIEFLEKRYKNLSIKDVQVIKETIDMTEPQETEEYRDINWSVTFDITENGEESAFESLAEADQDYILSQILEDYTYGTFDEINWSVEFDITVNGEELPHSEDRSLNELDDEEQKYIIDQIREGYYSGTFSNY